MTKSFTPELLNESYVLLEQLASGGMAEIFTAAKTNSLSRQDLVTIKRLLPELAKQKRYIDMMVAEAKLCTLLHHPNIVRVDDLGTANESFFIVSEWIFGQSLEKLLHSVRDKKQLLPISIVVGLLQQIAAAIDYLHNAADSDGRPMQLVHRDISPANILISYEGDVKLIDFGIATVANDKIKPNEAALGKLSYMSPEQIRNQMVDQRADLYSLGTVVFEMLTNKLPFTADNDLKLQELIVRGSPTPLRSYLPKAAASLELFLQNLLAQEIGKRPSNAKAIYAEMAQHGKAATPAEIGKFMRQLFHDELLLQETQIQKSLNVAPRLLSQNLAQQSRQKKSSPADAAERTAIINKTADVKTEDITDISKMTHNRATTNDELMQELLDQSGASYGLDPDSGETVFMKDEIADSQAATTFEPNNQEPNTDVSPKKNPPANAARNSFPGEAGQAVLGKLQLETKQKQRQEFLEQIIEPSNVSDIAPAPQPMVPTPAKAAAAALAEEPSLELDIRPEPEKAVKRTPSFNNGRNLPAEPAPKKSKAAPLIFIIVIAVIIGVGWQLLQNPALLTSLSLSTQSRSGDAVLLQPQVTLKLFAEKPQSQKEEKILGRFLAPSNVGTASSLSSLQDFFENEYQRRTKENDFKIKFDLVGPVIVDTAAPTETTLFNRQVIYEYFESQLTTHQAKSNTAPPSPSGQSSQQLTVYIYFYRVLDAGNDYPLEYFGYRRRREGIVFIPLDRERIEFSIVNVAHEIVHLLGGTDKFNDNGYPVYPAGFAAPEKQPLYPQDFAEIMARTLPISNDRTQPITKLNEVRLGSSTATEIGWLESNRL